MKYFIYNYLILIFLLIGLQKKSFAQLNASSLVRNILAKNDCEGEWDYQSQRCLPDCGIISNTLSFLISNGAKTSIELVPWHVVIYKYIIRHNKYEHICGGTIINTKVILTAAHCFTLNRDNIVESDTQHYKIIAGKNTRPYISNEPGTQVFSIAELYVHSNFQVNPLNPHDLAILHLNRRIEYTVNVKPICLDQVDIKDRSIDSGTMGIIPSWDEINVRRDTSYHLLSINSTAINYTKCVEGSELLTHFVSSDKFCVVYDRISITEGQLCRGDIGGGFVVQKSGRYYIRGILTNIFYIRSCPSCGSLTHAIFTNIREYLPEIDDFIKRKRIVVPSCSGYEFTCDHGVCISKLKLCNGFADCTDNSDESEKHCNRNICPGRFRCRYGGCIGINQRCDGIFDCVDQSDENVQYAGCVVTTTIATQIPRIRTDEFASIPIIDSRKGCVVPLVNYSRIYYLDKSNNKILPPYSVVGNNTFITYECVNSNLNSKYKMKDEKNKLYCYNKKWDTENYPKCYPTCNRQVLDAVSYKAICNETKELTCPKDIFPNKVVDLRCNFGYFEPETQFRVQSIKCEDDGEWDYKPQRCIPDCGIISPTVAPLISNGAKTSIEQVPWHVGIYSNMMNHNKFEQICGGTIINAKLILTAAHCFAFNRDNVIESDKQYYKVIAGKNTRSYILDEPGNQVFSIAELYVHSGFKGYLQNYHYDFAILNLKRSIEYSVTIKPICFDQVDIKDYSIDSGTMGIVPGWGAINATEEPSYHLLSINLTATSYTECVEDSEKIKTAVTGDKFCVVYDTTIKNQGQVCHGDSGGGFVIKKHGRYYIRGILSNTFKIGEINPTCGSSTHAIFTNIREHLREIDDFMKNNNPI